MNQVERIELSTAGDELLILERLDDRDVAVVIMDDEGNELRARIRSALVRQALEQVAPS